MKKKLILGFLVGYLLMACGFIFAGQAMATYWPKAEYGTWQSADWVYSDQNKTGILHGIYPTYEDARDACIAERGGVESITKTLYNWHMYSGTQMAVFDTVCEYVSRSHPTPDEYHVYVYPANGYTASMILQTTDPSIPLDSDGDGIPDDVDPYPNSGNDVAESFFSLIECYDENGDAVYKEIALFNEFGEMIGVETYGSRSEYENIVAGIEEGTVISNPMTEDPLHDPLNNDLHDIDDLLDYTKQDVNGSTEGNDSILPNVGDTNEIDPPPDNLGDVTDPGSTITTDQHDYTDQIGAVIDGLNNQIQNQQNQREVTENSNTLLASIKTAIDRLNNYGGIVVDTPSAEEIGQSVQQNIETWIDEEINAGQGTLDGLEDTDLTGYLADAKFDGTETEMSEINQKVADGYESIYDDFVANNPLLSVFGGHTLELSGSTSIVHLDFDFLGSADCDFAIYDSVYRLCGNFLVWLATFQAFGIVFRG